MNKISRRECTLKAVGWVYVGVCVLYLCFVGHLESDKRGYIIIKAKHKNLTHLLFLSSYYQLLLPLPSLSILSVNLSSASQITASPLLTTLC